MMNRITISMAAVALSLVVGCGATARMITAKSQSERADIFQEMPGGEPIPASYADLVIKASIKTHLEGYYAGESKESAHGKETYPFLVNIDGQAVLWRVAGKEHALPMYREGKASRDPEAGSGMKYVLEKKVRLSAGSHKVFIGLPEEPYYSVADISVAGGRAYVLEFKPKYRHKHVPTRIPTFFKGIAKYDVVFDESLM